MVLCLRFWFNHLQATNLLRLRCWSDLRAYLGALTLSFSARLKDRSRPFAGQKDIALAALKRLAVADEVEGALKPREHFASAANNHRFLLPASPISRGR